MIKYTILVPDHLDDIYLFASRYSNKSIEQLMEDALIEYVHNLFKEENFAK